MSVNNKGQGEQAGNNLEQYLSLSDGETMGETNVVKTTNQQGLINQASDEFNGGLDHPTLWTAVAIAIGVMVLLCCCCVCCCGCLAAIYKGATAAWKRAVRGATGPGAHASQSKDAENKRRILEDKAWSTSRERRLICIKASSECSALSPESGFSRQH